MFSKTKITDDSPKILIAEDDADQLDFMIALTLSEINKLISDDQTDEQQRKILKQLKIVKASSIEGLKKKAAVCNRVLFAIVDCNMPDLDKGTPNDQLVKTKHRITGQHRSVDIIIKHLPNTPITMVSSRDRFRRLINKYYNDKYALNINFIAKADQATISRNILNNLNRYIRLEEH